MDDDTLKYSVLYCTKRLLLSIVMQCHCSLSHDVVQHLACIILNDKCLSCNQTLHLTCHHHEPQHYHHINLIKTCTYHESKTDDAFIDDEPLHSGIVTNTCGTMFSALGGLVCLVSLAMPLHLSNSFFNFNVLSRRFLLPL